jgi:hypothetical protein
MKRISIVGLSVLVFVFLITTVQAGAQQTECAGGLQTHRLVLGWGGYVLPGDPNNVREQATRDSRLLGQIPSEAAFNVLEGPVCADGLLWWRVDFEGLIGWTPQSDGNTPWIGAIVPTREVWDTDSLIYGPDFDTFDVSFSASPTLFSHIHGERTSEQYSAPYAQERAAPARRHFELGGQPRGAMTVYSVSDLEAFSGSTPANIMTLAQALDEGTLAANLTALNEDDRYIALANYIQFQNGTGYRYITSVAADDEPTTSAGHYYRYYGLTSDREFYFELYFPISLPIATNSDEYFPAVRNINVQEFQTTVLNEVIDNPILIHPSLSEMDAFVASINIQDAAQTVNPVSQSTPTPLPSNTPTPTPTQTPTATSTPDGCFITALNDVNLRSGPDITFEVVRVLEAGETIRAIRRYNAGDGFFIYETEEHSFVHEDFTAESPLCSSLPLVEQ